MDIADNLDPNILQLGKIAGLITKEGQLDAGWFQDPIGRVKKIPNERGRELIEFLQNLLGSTAGQALGTPGTTPDRLWYPLQNPLAESDSEPDPNGIYIVTHSEGVKDIVGLGFLHSLKKQGLAFNVYGYFPLLELPFTRIESSFILGTSQSHSVELGFSIRGAKGAFDNGDISFDGVQFGVSFRPKSSSSSSGYFGLDIVILNLKLPWQSAGRDRSLKDLVNVGAKEWISIAISLLATQISRSVPPDEARQAKNIIFDLLSLLGLNGDLPSIKWEQLLDQPSIALNEWVKSIASSPDTVKNCLDLLYCLLNGKLPQERIKNVSGSGTRIDPWAIAVIDGEASRGLRVHFTAAVERDSNAALHLYPGMNAEFIRPIPSLAQQKTDVKVQASAELIELVYPATGAAPQVTEERLFPSLELSVGLLNQANPDTPLFKFDMADAAAFSIGAIQAGLSYSVTGQSRSRNIIPMFRLTDVRTKNGAWPAIDLTNFDKTISNITGIISSLAQKAIEDFLEAGDPKAGALAKNLAIILGVIPPSGLAAGQWNVPLITSDLDALISNPLGALMKYYSNCLTDAGGQRPSFKHLLPSFAELLGEATTTVDQITGAGTPTDPWMVPLIRVDTGPQGRGPMVASLRAWHLSQVKQPELHFGLDLSVPLPVQAVATDLGITIDLLSLSLPAENSTSSFGADWLQNIQTELRITGSAPGTPIQTPGVAGMSFKIGRIAIAAGWGKERGFYSDACINNITVSGTTLQSPPIEKLHFSSDSLSWDKNILNQLAQLLVNAAGLWLMEDGGKPGVLFATGLGLLPDLPSLYNRRPSPAGRFNIPPGVRLPEDWPLFNLKELLVNEEPTAFFIKPAEYVRAYLKKLFSKDEYVDSLKQVFEWALSNGSGPNESQSASAPGAGSVENPWLVNLPKASGLQLLFWAERDARGANATRVGLGLRKKISSQTERDVRLDTVARIDLAPIALDGSKGKPGFPRASIICDIANSNAGQPLLDDPITNTKINNARLGTYIYKSDGGFRLDPIVRLIPSGAKEIIELTGAKESSGEPANESFNCSNMQLMEAMLNKLMGKLSGARQSRGLIDEVLGLLADLGLAQAADIDNQKSYGINIGAWESLLANPKNFLARQMSDVFDSPQKSAAFYQHLGKLIGFELALAPGLKGLPEILAAVGLMEGAAGGYRVKPSRWLELLDNPVGFLDVEFKKLLENESARRRLITVLRALPPVQPPAGGPLVEFSIASGTNVRLAISKGKPLDLGSMIQAYGELRLDLERLMVTANIATSSNQLGVALEFQYVLDIEHPGNNRFQVALAAAPSSVIPPFDPMVIWPIDQIEQHMARIGKQAPVFLLSQLTSKVLNEYLLPDYPLAARLFEAFGLTHRRDDKLQIESLVGVLMHPIDWILSREVFGDGNGNISPGKLASKVAAVIEVLGAGGVTLFERVSLKPIGNNGLALNGLPYGSEIQLIAGDRIKVQLGIAQKLKSQGGLAGPEVSVSTRLSFAGGPADIQSKAELRFDAGKSQADSRPLTVSSLYRWQETPGAALQTQVRIKIERAGRPPFDLTLIPFVGLNEILSGAQEKLLKFVADQIALAYRRLDNNDPRKIVIAKIVDVAAALGFKNFDDLESALGKLKHQADLSGFFAGFSTKQRANDTLKPICALLQDTLLPNHADQIELKDGLLRFKPGLDSTRGSLVVSLGVKEKEGSAYFGIYIEPTVSNGLVELMTEAGVGAQMSPTGPTGKMNLLLKTSTRMKSERFKIAQIPGGPQLDAGFDLITGGAFQPSIKFYPVGAAESSTEPFLIKFLPEFSFVYGNSKLSADAWLLKLTQVFVIPLIADTIISTEVVRQWLSTKIGQSALTPGAILKEWNLIKADKPGYEINSVQEFLRPFESWLKSGDPFRIIEDLTARTLKSLNRIKIAEFGEAGSRFGTGSLEIVSRDGRYGIRLQASNLRLTSAPEAQAKASSSPATALLQLGKWHTDEESGTVTPWIKQAHSGWEAQDPGVAFYLVGPNPADPQRLAFKPGLDLISVGLDLSGVNNKPLIDVNGFRVNRIEPRIYLSVGGGKNEFGGSILCGGMGIPLGPDFGQEGKQAEKVNPIAQNLLASKPTKAIDGGGPRSNGASKEAINPGFSVKASDVTGGNFRLRLYDDKNNPSDSKDRVWLPLQRSFGPLHCRKLGVGWRQKPALKDSIFSLLFDGDVAIAGLRIDLAGLGVGIPVGRPTDFDSYELDLDGLGISFSADPIQVTGELIKTTGIDKSTGRQQIAYDGKALIKIKQYTIAGLGSYTVLGEAPSLFIFGFLDAPLGGPAFFYVTGVAAGFGYNRSIKIPDVDEIKEFPLVAFATGTRSLAGTNEQKRDAALGTLAPYIPPSLGSYWVAAGVRFTTYEFINSFALLIVDFSDDLQIVLLGLSKIQFPNKVKNDDVSPIVYAELALQAVFKPSEGVLRVTAALTPNSFVLDPACKLSGKFAFYAWFAGEHSGDFVLTLGGYHPNYVPKPWYPIVPRLAFNWPRGNLTIKGEAYFALTPSCVMAGGLLSAVYQSGELRAWFNAYADFFISWKPFYYDLAIGISIGVSYRLNLLLTSTTITAELGVDLNIWGPPFGGKVRVNWYVISFTIGFGADKNQSVNAIGWDVFRESFLPEKKVASLKGAALKADAPTPAKATVCQSRIESGLVGSDGERWLVRADSMVFSTRTSIPASEIQFGSSTPRDPIRAGRDKPIGIRPMKLQNIESVHKVKITNQEGEALNLKQWAVDELRDGVPSALWGNNSPGPNQAPPDADQVLPGMLVGVQFKPKHNGGSYKTPGEIKIRDLAYSEIKPIRDLPLRVRVGTKPDAQPPDRVAVIKQSITQPGRVENRQNILRAIVSLGVDVNTDVQMDIMAAKAELVFVGNPTIGPLGKSPEAKPLPSGGFIRAGSAEAARSAEEIPEDTNGLRARQAPHVQALMREYWHPVNVAEKNGPPGLTALSREFAISGAVEVGDAYAGQDYLQSLRRAALPATDSGTGDLADEADESYKLKLRDGMTAVWNLPRDSSRWSIDSDRRLPIRVTVFDMHNLLLDDEVVEVTASTAYKIPDGGARVALRAIPPASGERTPAVGWQGDSTLIQVNPIALLGEGVVIRPQAPFYTLQDGRAIDCNLVEAEQVIKKNQVDMGDSRIESGWVETIMPRNRSITTIAVLVKQDEGASERDDDPASNLTVMLPRSIKDGDVERVEQNRLVPEDKVIDGKAGYFLYSVPDASLDDSQKLLRIRIQPPPGWLVNGVIGTRGDAKSKWSQLTLDHNPVPLDLKTVTFTKVELIRES